jgi:hypothetical protein
VAVSIEIDGRAAPLLPARDGSGRWYLEARRGSAYAIRLANRTGTRLGVELRVDGLDVIDGEAPPAGGRGRLYILSPGSSTLVRGWRSSLDAVQRFEFVDEQSSYAARAHKAGARLGWIEARVFRERGARGRVTEPPPRVSSAPPEPSPESADSARPEARAEGRARSHPGTGWGERIGDRATLVDFEAEPAPAESVVVRYEYGDALRALGIRSPCDPWGRLWERERGEGGFAQPPPH